MEIARYRSTVIEDLEGMPPILAPLFGGPWANLTFGGTAAFLGDGSTITEVPVNQKVFALRQSPVEVVGGVLVQGIDVTNRRACVHVSVFPAQGNAITRGRHVVRGLVLAGVILGDCFGIERFWTYVDPSNPGPKAAILAGLKVEGRLCGHVLRPGGRGDMLLLGGLWKDIRKQHSEMIAEIEWAVPDGSGIKWAVPKPLKIDTRQLTPFRSYG
jgi:hypothetical protein